MRQRFLPHHLRSVLILAPLAAMAIAIVPFGGASAYTLDTLHAFCKQTNCTDGKLPLTGLAMADGRHFFGTAPGGGANNEGVVFELTRQQDGSWKYKIVYNFCSKPSCADGSEPESDLIVDKDGLLYGTTYSGGTGEGTVYQLQHTSTGWIETVIYRFCASGTCPDGQSPVAGLSYAGQATGAPWDHFSPLFGTTSDGGTYSHGVAYKLISDGSLWNEDVIHNFKTGIAPSALLVDPAGNLYGGTSDGGLHNNAGLVFKLAHDTWTETVLHNFCAQPNCTDGDNPTPARPTIDASGNVYGTTINGGSEGGGVMYRITPAGAYSMAFDFTQPSVYGETPYGGATPDGNGNFFVPLYGNGPNVPHAGTVVKLHHGASGWTESLIYAFCSKTNCKDGAYPHSTLIFDKSGDLLGTTAAGGSSTPQGGTVFELTP
jgi:uncharacterized repeat protein (TIGR03803 family)